MGQSLWLDNITRRLLNNGSLHRYIQEFTVSGLTSNLAIFEQAIRNSRDYDDGIRQKMNEGKSGEALFFELALEDLRQSADLFRPIHLKTSGLDGWVSLDLAPRLAHDSAGTIAASRALHAQAKRSNLFLRIPGTSAGLVAIEQAIFAGIPINVTHLFSRSQYLAAAEAHLCGLERRLAAGLKPDVASVASLVVSDWDAAVEDKEPEALRHQLGLAVAGQCYAAYLGLLESPRWQRLQSAGARRQRIVWSSTGAGVSDKSGYITGLAAPLTINTLPEATLIALADHREIQPTLPDRTGEATLAKFTKAKINPEAMAAQLQEAAIAASVVVWDALLTRIANKCELLGAQV